MAPERGCVLDSSAVLAYLRREPGAERVEPRLADAVICSVNLGEVLAKLVHRGLEPARAVAVLQSLNLIVVHWTEEMVWAGAALSPWAWERGLSLADRACLTVAQVTGRTAVTSDALWAEVGPQLQPPVEIELFRRAKKS